MTAQLPQPDVSAAVGAASTPPAILAGLSAPDSRSGQLQRAVLDLLLGPKHRLAGALPTSIRFLFYELEHMGLVTKGRDRGKRHDGMNLSDALMRLRELGVVPWEWIVDETRSLDVWASAASVYAYALDAIEEARLDCWAGRPAPLIITESRSLAGVLRGISTRYLCPIAATNGQAGGFLHTDLAPFLAEPEGRRVIYLGDLDPSGGHIEAHTRNTIEAVTGPLTWERLAITAAQVEVHDLPPIHKTDRRYVGGKDYLAWETEALGQVEVQSLVIQRLDELLPEPLADVRIREQEQRDTIKRRLVSA